MYPAKMPHKRYNLPALIEGNIGPINAAKINGTNGAFIVQPRTPGATGRTAFLLPICAAKDLSDDLFETKRAGMSTGRADQSTLSIEPHCWSPT